MQTRLRLRGFGMFIAEVDGTPADLPPITRTVLARLVLARGSLVYADDLHRDAWPEPATVIRREQRVGVHKRIGELRRVLPPGLLVTERSARTGYRLLLDGGEVDLYVFADLVFRAAVAHDEIGVDLLIAALAMWTEPPLLGLPDKPFVADHVAHLVRLRDRACRALVAGCRAQGRTRDAIAALDRLHTRNPDDIGLRELAGDPLSVTSVVPGPRAREAALP
ncbi:BTAD domain-containing putative transcriptional regulator [Actinoplanes sp. NPDC049265]|uniref:AfsR/SARP family transcriptional regulator n=1 Tax=Actinoplanes sp. NPDC049265 TaxID=3363902 RepID=UPI0037133A7F